MGFGVLFFLKIIWLLLLCCVAAIDFQFRKVKNFLVVAFLIFGIASIVFNVNPFGTNVGSALIGAAAAFVFFIVFYQLKIMGAGDVKFALVLGVWLGLTSGLFFVFLWATIFSLLHALFELYVLRNIRSALFLWGIAHGSRSEDAAIGNSPSKVRTIPYAGYMAVAAIFWMLRGAPSVNLLSV